MKRSRQHTRGSASWRALACMHRITWGARGIRISVGNPFFLSATLEFPAAITVAVAIIELASGLSMGEVRARLLVRWTQRRSCG